LIYLVEGRVRKSKEEEGRGRKRKEEEGRGRKPTTNSTTRIIQRRIQRRSILQQQRHATTTRNNDTQQQHANVHSGRHQRDQRMILCQSEQQQYNIKFKNLINLYKKTKN